MSVTVVTPPSWLVEADEAKTWAPVLAGDDDGRVTALLKIAQAAIEPPNGWLGRALGEQTLQAAFDDFDAPCLRLPFPPLRGVVSVTHRGIMGTDLTIAVGALRIIGVGTALGSIEPLNGAAWPAVAPGRESVRVVYKAGYAGDDPQILPVKQAIVLAATQLRSLSTQDLALRSRDVSGVGSWTWTVSDAAEKLIRGTVENLLTPLRVYG